MVTEVAELTVREGAEAEFEAVMREQAVPLLRRQPGAVSVRFGRGVENPSKFAFVVDWESLEAHVAATKGPDWPTFRGLFGDFTTGGAMMHYDLK